MIFLGNIMINKTLFNTLCCFTKQYKQPLPEVKNENQPIVWKDMIQFDKTGTPYKSKQVIDSGEEYVLNCPFCGDTRHRFYINHMWGTKDDSSGSLNLWLMHCYNENCEENIENQDVLKALEFKTRLDIFIIIVLILGVLL